MFEWFPCSLSSYVGCTVFTVECMLIVQRVEMDAQVLSIDEVVGRAMKRRGRVASLNVLYLVFTLPTG